ncbi:MAG: PPOX class F420-dependent oxidoreductase [Myxococcota bacterium]|nr:PPOX class F420-dependent oxidoreductase [Myxococcota bacterium]
MATATETLGDAPYVSLATFRRDGREVRTPVWVAREGEHLYVFSEAKAGKVKRIRATKRVAVAACNVRGDLKGDFTGGVGKIASEPDVIERGYAALIRKYGWQMRLTNFFSTLTGRIHSRALLEVTLDD